MKAEIVVIGDEILIGQVTDTNSGWIAAQLNLNGIEVFQTTAIHDESIQIIEVLSKAEGRVDLVIITGGLGPTSDDITRTTLCSYFNTQLVFHEPTFIHISNRFRNRGIPLNRLNRDQALVPENCTVLFNKNGTAPGMWFEKGNTIFISLPGVPYEMKDILADEVFPRLRASGRTRAIYHKTVLTQGIPESVLAEKLISWESRLPDGLKLAYLPSPMAVRLRLSAMGDNEEFLAELVEKEVSSLKEIIGEHIYGYNDDQIAGSVGSLLKERNLFLAVAESCTGGYISHLVTSIPGSSGWYKGSVTAYSNQVKQELLNVDPEMLFAHGAVSEPVAKAMVEGVRNLLRADYAVATTGIAGPDGGSPEKPVGTVWIAVAGMKGTYTAKYVFGENRERNIIRSGQTALQMLRKIIISES